MIIGITGTLGAGKGTVVEYLVSKYGYKHYSARDFLTKEAAKRNKSITGRTSGEMTLHDLGDELRTISPTYIMDALYDMAQTEGGDAVIESIHTVAEAESLRANKNFTFWGVDADVDVRYARIKERKTITDNVSLEEFKKDNEWELTNNDPNKHNIGACIKLADRIFYNNSTREDLWSQVDQALGKI